MNPDGQRPTSKKKWLKESNVMDRKVNEYMVGLDALLQAESIKAEIIHSNLV